MSLIQLDNDKCLKCGGGPIQREVCLVCDGGARKISEDCRGCGGTGETRTCANCGADYWRAMRERKKGAPADYAIASNRRSTPGGAASPNASGSFGSVAPRTLSRGEKGMDAPTGQQRRTTTSEEIQMSTDVHQGRPWTLQPRAHAKPGPHFWTGQDYTSDASKALRFASQDDAQRWLNAHRHVKAMLLAVKLPEAEAKP